MTLPPLPIMKCFLVVGVFLYGIKFYANGAFTETPVSLEVFVGAKAVFNCQHFSASIIRWRVNGSFVGGSPPVDITPGTKRSENGTLVDTLTIIARTVYNKTTIVCVAQFYDGTPDEETIPVILSVLPSDSSTTNMPVISMSRFLEVPMSKNVTVGEMVNFRCNHSEPDTIGWMVNDSLLNRLDSSSITQSSIFRLPDGSALSVLTIEALREYNRSSITCLALFDGAQAEYSPIALLQIQGYLDAIRNIERNSTTITWVPPPSLDLTSVDPDIVYCVEVYNITCGQREFLIGDCNVIDPSYDYSYLDPGFIYEIVITPRSNVNLVDNGTRSMIDEQFVFFRKAELNFTYKYEIINTSMVDVAIVIQLLSNLSESNLRWPSTYVFSLASSDEVNDSLFLTRDTIAIINYPSIEADLVLPLKRLWNITLLAYGCRQDILTERAELSTHEFQWVSLRVHFGILTISGYFIDGSNAIGVLTVVYQPSAVNRNLDHDISYILTIRSFGKMSLNFAIGHISSDLSDMLVFSVFTVEKNGLPFSRSVSNPKRMSATKIKDTRRVLFNIRSILASDRVCITCIFLDSSATDCVAVVHQRISQLSSSGLMDIESSHKFNRSGDTAYGCIEGVNMTYYQVGVINGIKYVPSYRKAALPICKTECVVGSALGAATTIMLMIIMAICAFKMWTKRKETGCTPGTDHGGTNIEVNRCAAYEIPSLARQKVFMENNPAYEEINRCFTVTTN